MIRSNGKPKTATSTLAAGVKAALLAVSVLAMASGGAKAQDATKGRLSGVIVDAEDRLPIPNARVGAYAILPGDSAWTMVKGMASGIDGGYSLEVAPGLYRLIASLQSYTPTVLDDIKVSAGDTVETRVTLVPRPIQIEGVQVKGTELRGTEASALSKQKKAAAVSDAITSEQIQKSTDSNAAEALQRVTGLSVVGGRYVYVRGLGERYSSTQINGASVGTPEPNKRVVPLDVFPSGVLDNVVVQKSYTPDQDGEFGGGVVNLNTKDFVDGKRFTQSLTTGASAGALSREFLTYPGGRFDFLGFDDGRRGIPGTLSRLAGDRRVAPATFGGEGLTPEQVQEIGRSFENVWTPRGEGAKPNYAYSASFSRGLTVLGKEVGFLSSLSFNNSFNSLSRENNAYVGTAQDLTPLYLYKVEESTARVLGGALGNLSVRLADQQALRLRMLYTRSAEDNARVSNGPNFDYGSEGVRITHLGYVERGLLSGVLSGDHTFAGLGRLVVDWNSGYSLATRNEPDRREYVTEIVDPATGEYQISRRVIPLTRIFGEMLENDRSQRLNLAIPLRTWSGRESKLKVGGAHRSRSRDSSFRRFGFRVGTQAVSNLDLSLPPESLLVDENIRPGYFTFLETTRDNDRYRAGQRLNAGYVMADVPVLKKLRMVGGLRYEKSEISVDSRSPYGQGIDASYVTLTDEDALPAVNLTYSLTGQSNIRASFSNTISRPEFRELSPFSMYDYETGYSEQGNPDVKSSMIGNYDLRLEQFLDTRELLAVSVFHKNLERPIENVVEPTSGGYSLFPRNGHEGRLNGTEFEMRIGAARIWDAFAKVFPLVETPSALQHFGLSANYSRVRTSVRVKVATADDGSDIEREGPLNGQSSYSLNLGFFYGSKAFEGSVLYTAFGRRLSQVGAGQYPNKLPDIYEYPLQSLDLTVSKDIAGMRLKLSAENLLNDVVEFRQGDEIARRYVPGRVYALSFQWR